MMKRLRKRVKGDDSFTGRVLQYGYRSLPVLFTFVLGNLTLYSANSNGGQLYRRNGREVVMDCQ
jgi:hypothetical protein